MKRNYQMPNEDPKQMKFELPSEKEHLLNVIEVKENTETNPDIIRVKLEVVGGDEAGRTLLHRLDLDENSKAFWVTRLFLKAIGEPYKGNVDVDTDRWYAQELIATVTVSKILSYIKIDEKTGKIVGMPKRGEIVDAVWREINMPEGP